MWILIKPWEKAKIDGLNSSELSAINMGPAGILTSNFANCVSGSQQYRPSIEENTEGIKSPALKEQNGQRPK